VDLAWREDAQGRVANESGVAAIDATGRVLDVGWSRGLGETIAWIEAAAADGPALLFVDAPLVVDNPKGQRPCETQVGQRYGRWGFSAKTTRGCASTDRGMRGRLSRIRGRRQVGPSGATGNSDEEANLSP
jgi:predicted RNase H-like nuclease